MNRRLGDVAAAALLIILDLLLYRKIVRLWWTFDDASTLRTIFDYKFLDFFFSRAAWPQQLFTPLLPAIFKAQFGLFGFDPPWWYAAQLAIFCVTTLAIYGAVRMFLPVVQAFAGAALFAAGVPLCSVVIQLSTVHYFLAIAFGAFATIAYVVALRRDSKVADALSAFLYLIAMLAKEIAVPLPLVLIFLPVRDSRSRLKFAGAHALALIVYFSWRRFVLGTFLGSYGWAIGVEEWPQLIAKLPWRLIQGAAGTGFNVGVIAVAFAILGAIVAARSRASLTLLIIALIVAVGPVLPVAKEINRRYIVVFWLVLSVAFAVGLTRIRNPRWAAAAAALMLVLTIGVNRQEWRDVFAARHRMSDEARFFFEMPPDALLRRPLTPPSVMGELHWLRTIHFGRPAGGPAFYDDFYLCAHGASGKRVSEYDPARRTIVDITPRVAEISKRFCGSIRADAPLTAHFRFSDPALHWELGPYDDGRYSAVLGDGLQAFDLPRRDALNMAGAAGFTLRIRYDSPQGWTTYSPELTLDFARQPDFVWHR